ncbi:uncharacterized protein BJX67DRAFT_17962 [Aspergillus lucknowensis]|uniref:Uncharacterized protein n=1 Tax=Aspergillus lucknowensis TaxID=176173 RepID=A0ABR4M848_9EURO
MEDGGCVEEWMDRGVFISFAILTWYLRSAIWKAADSTTSLKLPGKNSTQAGSPPR